MSDLFDRVTDDQDIFKKLLDKIPGFNGYIERSNRRSADKMLRESIADRFSEQWQRISSLQRDLISHGELHFVDDLEASALKLRQFIDRVRTTSYGYSGFFDVAKVKEEELAEVYRYDLSMFTLVENVTRAVDNVETSMGTEGLPASIRHLTTLGQECLDVFNRRTEILQGGLISSSVDEIIPQSEDDPIESSPDGDIV